jgi:hypothetical protein
MKSKELDKLKSRLPNNWRITLWKRLNDRKDGNKFSLSAIYRVMRGDYENFEIINAALELAEEVQRERDIQKQRISEL